jgi:hypothetical protein
MFNDLKMKSKNIQLGFINAICNIDFSKIRNFLDDDVLHCGATKDMFMDELIVMLAGLCEMHDGEMFYHNKWECKYGIDSNCKCDKKHDDPVRFQIGSGCFIWNLKETTNGKFTIERCDSVSEDEFLVPFGISIPEDLLANFEPDDDYLLYEQEVKRTLFPLEKGDILFWTLDDLEAWLINNQQVIKLSNEYKSYSVFWNAWEFFENCLSLSLGMNNEDLFRKANNEFSKLNKNNAFANWLFVREYIRYDITKLSLTTLALNNLNEGYFTFSYFHKNLRFSCQGQEQFFTFLKNFDLAKANCGEYNLLIMDIDIIIEDMDKPFDEKYIIPEYYTNLRT